MQVIFLSDLHCTKIHRPLNHLSIGRHRSVMITCMLLSGTITKPIATHPISKCHVTMTSNRSSYYGNISLHLHIDIAYRDQAKCTFLAITRDNSCMIEIPKFKCNFSCIASRYKMLSHLLL